MFNEMMPMAMGGGGGKCKYIATVEKGAGQGNLSVSDAPTDATIFGFAYNAAKYIYTNFDGNGDISSTVYEFTFADVANQRKGLAILANGDVAGFIALSTAVAVKSEASYTLGSGSFTININVGSGVSTWMGLIFI